MNRFVRRLSTFAPLIGAMLMLVLGSSQARATVFTWSGADATSPTDFQVGVIPEPASIALLGLGGCSCSANVNAPESFPISSRVGA